MAGAVHRAPRMYAAGPSSLRRRERLGGAACGACTAAAPRRLRTLRRAARRPPRSPATPRSCP
eukprot:14129668-Heterocapsa_arctica.AAC.1